jgi:tricorn protease
MLRAVSTFFLVAILLTAIPAGAEEGRLLRFADIHGDQVAFVYAGDIWLASTAGGDARRLTSHEGMELFPKFSPDGQRIAFSAEYGGSRQVFVIGVGGGKPEQLTWYNDVGPMPPRGGFDYRILDWTPDGKEILFRGNRLPWGVRMGRPYLVPAAGGMERALEIPESGAAMFSPDGTSIVFTPIDREWRTWKRHEGGRAQDVWTYDLKKSTSKRLTDWKGTDNQPLWIGDTIYFTSDRADGRLNLWASDEDGGNPRQVTFHEDFDVLWPSAGPSSIVYEAGGYLYRFDTADGSSAKIDIRIHGDFLQRMPRHESVSDFIQSADISPTGKRAVFGARGDVFTVPASDGEARNLTRTPGIREMEPTWSPDGSRVAYLSDRDGEYDLYVRSQDGAGDEERITTDCDTWRFPPVWSPDSNKLAFGDTRQRLRYADLASGEVVDVDTGRFGPITTYVWSPDSRWLAYTKTDDAQFNSIWVREIGGDNRQLTGSFTNDYSPSFDPDGRYLYFLSDRDWNLSFSGYEFNYFYTDPTRVYAGLLKADGPALFQPKSDEEETKKKETNKEESEDGDAEGKKKDEVEKLVTIDFKGFDHRVVALPDGSSNFASVQAVSDGVLFVRVGDDGPEVRKFSLESEEVETILPGVGNYVVSADGKKLLYAAGGNYGIADVKPGQKPDAGRLDLSGMTMKIDPQAEWRQIFKDGWRITRDWFYDDGMHGLDWQAIHDLYAPLVPHIAHRGDLDYILGEMGGELNAGHFYVNWGDMPRADRTDNGLLGAEIVAHDSGYFEIARIFPGENWQPGFRSPLTEPGVDVEVGAFILAVDGRSTRGVKNFYELLEASADRAVVLRVNSRPKDDDKARDVTVRPIRRETNLRYLEWTAQRKEMVDRLSGGRIGYIHLPNTAVEGNRELRKHFYPQAHRDALIFDARYNGGGFIPDRMMELISRQRLSSWARRGIEPFDTPGYFHEGPKACLANGYSSSGGDAFPYYFRKLGLGPIVGTRTWGGLIGLSGNPGFMDGGSLNVPTFRFMDTDGHWAVENVGVAPDVEVIDRSEWVAMGRDPSLEKAIEMLLEELKKNPPKGIVVPTPPRTPR